VNSARAPRIYVIAGVNGAGKSSLAGATFTDYGAEYYNPDEVARELIRANPRLTQTEANSKAWHAGVKLLESAISEHLDFAFETTLGANTIPKLLALAAQQGVEVNIWYVGLDSPELHIARVKSRVRRGGHDIPEQDIRRRYRHSRINLIELLPLLNSLRLFDNSEQADPATGHTPKPILVFSWERGKILEPSDLTQTPEWAKPIVAAALRLVTGMK
jgi:predicted ABC-type ATPase